MYTLRFYRSNLGSAAAGLLHQEPARTVGELFTAYVPGKVTQVSRLTIVHPMILEKLPAYHGSQLSAPATGYNHGKSNYNVIFWKTHPGIEDDQCTSKFLEKTREYRCIDLLHQEPARTMGEPFTAYVYGEVAQVSRMTNVHPKVPGEVT